MSTTAQFKNYSSARQEKSLSKVMDQQQLTSTSSIKLHKPLATLTSKTTNTRHMQTRVSLIVQSTLILIDLIIFRMQTIQTAPTITSSTREQLQGQQQTSQASGTLEANALNYLQKYGYMSPPTHLNQNGEMTNNNLVSEESFSSAISEFQRFAGIPATGLIDNQTLQFMRMPRCGNSDKAAAEVAAKQARPSSMAPVYINKTGQLTQSRSRFLHNTLRRRKRYALQGSKWRRQQLSYRISQYPTRFNGKRHEVDAQIEKAFGIWSQVAPIDFIVKRDGRVHIDIRFASGDHGDGDAFDGPGNTLAHAYFPQYGGDAHFDDQEYWTIDSYAGTNIFQVAAHELGHSLGLGHSNVREALMAPFYQKYKPNFKLHMDDVLAIQALYGEKPLIMADLPPPTTSTTTTVAPTTTTTTTTSTPSTSRPAGGRYPSIYKGLRPTFGDRKPSFTTTTTTTDGREVNDNDNDNEKNVPDLSGNGVDGNDPSNADSATHPSSSNVPTSGGGGGGGGGGVDGSSYPADLCSDSSIDAITRTEDGSSYVFKGDFYWLLTQDGLARGYPRRIATDWEGLPGHLDAALTWADGKTFFFKGNKYWRFRNRRRDVGYPKLISAGFAGIPDDIDTAFVWSGNGRTYIFKGNDYWRFDSKADPPVSSEYPRPIKVWSGVPGDIDAAFKWENNVTYFFKGNQYYRFNDKDFKVESRGRPAFPRQTSEWWFGCVNSNLAQRTLSSSLKELRPRELGDAPSQQQAAASDDWSFLAGLEENTRLLGTHISDQKPPTDIVVSPNSKDNHNPTKPDHDQSDQADQSSTSSIIPMDFVSPPTITKRSSTINGFRIGLFDYQSSSSASSSPNSSNTAILFSGAQIYSLLMLALGISIKLSCIPTRTPLGGATLEW